MNTTPRIALAAADPLAATQAAATIAPGRPITVNALGEPRA